MMWQKIVTVAEFRDMRLILNKGLEVAACTLALKTLVTASPHSPHPSVKITHFPLDEILHPLVMTATVRELEAMAQLK